MTARTERPASENVAARAARESSLSPRVPDLRISIDLVQRGHEKRIRYLLSAVDPDFELNERPFFSAPLRSDPQSHLTELFEAVESLRLDSEDDRETAVVKMANKGADLYQKLVPIDLQRELWRLHGEVAAVLVQTDDETTSIPWELIKIRDPDDESTRGPFLCEAFDLARWLPGTGWVTRLPLDRPALVAPASSGLASARYEQDELSALFARHGHDPGHVPARFRVLHQRLTTGGHGCWHFTGHGLVRPDRDADRWPIALDSKEPLRPEDLHAGSLRAIKPLVFLNACQTGRHGLSFTGVGGWASRFLLAGAGAFVGCHWSVPDDRAAELAIGFYRRLLDGVPIGRAMRESRLELRDRHPGDPTWLAYTLFAHPLASVPAKVAELDTAERRSALGNRPPSRLRRQSTQPPEPETPEERPARPAEVPGPRAGEERAHEIDGTTLLFVPGGVYTIGDDGEEWSRPAHRIRLSPYWIAKHPVTNRQYARFLEASPGHPRPQFWDDPRFNQPQQPVVGVSWHEAAAYCRWASLSLPSEAQWEVAARGTDGRRFPWGEEPPDSRRANFGNRIGAPSEVGSHPAGAGPFGGLDQAGNVWEWCLDGWELTPYRDREDRRPDPVVSGDPSIRAVRGGSWTNPAGDLASARRNRSAAKQRFNDQGFRCLLLGP